jgi:hypothetical protein
VRGDGEGGIFLQESYIREFAYIQGDSGEGKPFPGFHDWFKVFAALVVMFYGSRAQNRALTDGRPPGAVSGVSRRNC